MSSTGQSLPPPQGKSDTELTQNPLMPVGKVTVGGPPMTQPIVTGYTDGSILDLAYGANDPNVMASQMVQSGEMFRLQRGYPYRRGGRFAPVLPQFKAQGITIQNLRSQPQANASSALIVTPKADNNTTNSTTGTAVIGYPGSNSINIT